MIQKIIILDFGSQYTQLIGRAVREANVYCEIIPFNKPIPYTEDLIGIILSRSHFSVNEDGAAIVNIPAEVIEVTIALKNGQSRGAGKPILSKG